MPYRLDRDTLLVRKPDRRNHVSRESTLCSVARHFLSRPGLWVTTDEASLLFGLREDICHRVLGTLRAQGILQESALGGFYRADAHESEGGSRSRP